MDIYHSDHALDCFTSFQSMVLMGLAESMMRAPPDKIDPFKERRSMYDRELGATINVNHNINPDSGTGVISQTNVFIGQFIGSGKDESPTELLQGRSLLPAEIRPET
jgi:hypothetical protein